VLWVVIPALNEAENLCELIPRVLDSARTVDRGARVLVVDDGSTDSTFEVMARLVDQDDAVVSARLRRNLGKAAALEHGFEVALKGGATTIVMMDADGQDDPAELPHLYDEIERGADLVTGARRKRMDRFVKRNTSKLYNAVTGAMSGAPGKDFNSGFKMMRAEVARGVAPMMYGELHRYLTVIAHWQGFRVTEVPVEHHARMHGQSKYGLSRFWRGFVDLLTVRFLMSYQHRPSHLFGGIGAVASAVGGLILLYLTILKLTGETLGDRPLLLAGVLLFLVGLQLQLFGLLAELVVFGARRGSRMHHD